jgi:hypothetical protein
MMADKKKPAEAGFCLGLRNRARSGGGLERLDAGVDATLVAGRLVAMDQAAGAEPVEDRHGGLVGGFRAGGIVGLLTAVRSMERWLTLRALRTMVCLARFLADLMLATR